MHMYIHLYVRMYTYIGMHIRTYIIKLYYIQYTHAQTFTHPLHLHTHIPYTYTHTHPLHMLTHTHPLHMHTHTSPAHTCTHTHPLHHAVTYTGWQDIVSISLLSLPLVRCGGTTPFSGSRTKNWWPSK